MGKFTEQGKQFDIFSTEFPYKVVLLYGDRLAMDNGESTLFEQITYYCKAHGETYRIRNSFDKFFCDEYVLDESDLDNVEDVIGIGLDVEITVDDLDAMFGDWENFAKKLKPVNEDTIDALLDAVPELQEPMPDLTMEDKFKAEISYADLKKKLDKLHSANAKDVENALGALLYNLSLDKKSEKEDATKISGKYRRRIKQGEIWKVQFTRGVGHEVQDVRPALVISDNGRNAVLGTIMCLGIEGYPVVHTYNQVGFHRDSDVTYIGTERLNKEDSRVELSQVFTLDRARFIKKYGDIKPEKLNEVLVLFKKYYKLPNVFPEPIELDFGFDEPDEK